MRDLSAIIQILSVVMLLPLFATLMYLWSNDLLERLVQLGAFIIPSAILFIICLIFKKISVDGPTKTKHIMVSFALTWVVIAAVGSLPFMIRGVMDPLDSFFESMSGWTTTGYSMIRNIGETDRDLLFYRSIMQGMGGLGVLSLGLMVLLHGGKIGVGYSDVGVQRIKPGIKQTIMEAWKIYGLYILLGFVLLYLAGMSPFDAINHSITSIATGGFTTHENAGHYANPLIEAILMILMLLGMTSFIIHYKVFSGDNKAFSSTELKYGIMLIPPAILLMTFSLFIMPPESFEAFDNKDLFKTLWVSSFHVISGMSTCGFNTVDFGQFPDFSKTLMSVLMYIGGMASSTSGGIRIIRFVIMLKAIKYSLKKLILPKSAIVVVKLDGRALREDIMTVVGYSSSYLFVCIGLAMILMLLGYGSIDSIVTIMSAMGNDGLGVLSGETWYCMHYLGKITIILAMWIGRVEIYASLFIFKSIIENTKII